MNWDEVKLEGDPLLIVGLRDERRQLTGYRVNVDMSVHSELKDVAAAALEKLKNPGALTRTPYTPYVDQAEDEYLAIDPAELVPKPPRRARRGAAIAPTDEDTGQLPTEKEETAALVSMIKNADYLDAIGAGQLLVRAAEEFYLQAICFQASDTRMGFVSRSNNRRILSRSLLWLGRDDQNDRLKRISKPEIVLEGEVHAIVAAEEIAVLNRTQFHFLVSDTDLVAAHVPAMVKSIAERFSSRGLKLSDVTRQAIEARARASIALAKRLDAFAARVDAVDVSRISSGAGFRASDLEPADFVNEQGEIECAPTRVGELLDALEGRFFDDAFSPERRRADRFRPRA